METNNSKLMAIMKGRHRLWPRGNYSGKEAGSQKSRDQRRNTYALKITGTREEGEDDLVQGRKERENEPKGKRAGTMEKGSDSRMAHAGNGEGDEMMNTCRE